MSSKDRVKQAALEALKRPTEKKVKKTGTSQPDKKSKSSKSKAVLPEKGSAEAEVHKQAALEAAKSAKAQQGKKSEVRIPEKGGAEAEVHKQAALEATKQAKEPPRPLPEKGAAEAAVHNMAAQAGAEKATGASSSHPNSDEGFGFLLLALLLPLAIVGGLYAYASHMQNKISKTMQAASNQSETASGTGEKSASAALENAARRVDPTLVDKQNTTPADNNLHKPATTKSNPRVDAAPVTTTKPGDDAQQGNTPKNTANPSDKTGASWNYQQTNWSALDPAYRICGEGSSQSPIDIRPGGNKSGPVFQYNYFPARGKVINTGPFVQIELLTASNTPAVNQLLVNGKPYDLKIIRFHTPGEHLVNGKAFPMEVQLIHENAWGQKAIVAVMVEAGATNPLIDHMPVPEQKGAFAQSDGAHINPVLLLPGDRRSWTFTGSLTTPPCTQNVGWIVLQSPLTVSADILAKFRKVTGKNNRPVQPANGRIIYNAF